MKGEETTGLKWAEPRDRSLESAPGTGSPSSLFDFKSHILAAPLPKEGIGWRWKVHSQRANKSSRGWWNAGGGGLLRAPNTTAYQSLVPSLPW